jgi:hypothetical protein
VDLAHGVGGGSDLPIPAGAAALGGALALSISFVVVTLAWRKARFDRERAGRRLPRLTRLVDARLTRITVRGAGLLLLAFTTVALLAGPNSAGANPAFGMVFVVFWVGLVPASLMLGPVVRAINPARTAYACLRLLAKRDRGAAAVTLPTAVGLWPAAAGLLAFAWLELVHPDPTTAEATTTLLAVWAVVVLGGAMVFGETWIERADPFEAYSTLVAHLSPWRRSADGTIELVNPLRNLAAVRVEPGLVAVVAVLLGSTAYDSFAGSTRWLRFRQATDHDVVLLESGVLVAGVVAVALVFVLATAVPAHLVGVAARDIPSSLAHSLVPIAIGYVAAHYLTLLVETGQSTMIQASDPLGRGWDLFGTADRQVDLWLSLHPTLLASLKVGFIVVGHLIGAVAAHDRSISLLPARHHVTAQVPLMLAMVAYTFGGLTLLLGV